METRRFIRTHRSNRPSLLSRVHVSRCAAAMRPWFVTRIKKEGATIKEVTKKEVIIKEATKKGVIKKKAIIKEVTIKEVTIKEATIKEVTIKGSTINLNI